MSLLVEISEIRAHEKPCSGRKLEGEERNEAEETDAITY